MRERDLFAVALQIVDSAERAAFVDKACAGDAVLRGRMEVLLQAFDGAGGFLKQPAAAEATGPFVFEPALDPAAAAPPEDCGAVIGRYKLLQQFGEGGMGTVFLAEQQEPVRRLVALKIIKAGMDSQQVVRRFEAERQALALMDHPNIAKVLDGGNTASGRPYFVMELVKGIPITRYCDQEQLGPQERLGLFIPVCQAVQHAHQKGIIHRDLKPSNILIGLYDGQPVPKVIDFGVAKATQQRLTERTLFTEVGRIIGTLEYMAPEQAELNNLDIDTRADIYALGVLLYELLTGSPPFTGQQLRSAAFSEMLRMIREVEPPMPSTRLSSSEQLPAIAAKRRLEPRQLTRVIRGDLDWITMKCLEKERRRRYETANALAMDLQCYLTDEPVLAGPPSPRYRLRKFLRRNRRSVLAAAVVLLASLTGALVSTWQAVRATSAEQLAQEDRDKAVQAEAKVKHERDQAIAASQRAVEAEHQEKKRAQELQQERDHTLDALTEAKRHLANSSVLLAQSACNGNDGFVLANHFLDRVPAAFRHWEWYYLKRQYQGGLFTLQGHRDEVTSVAFSSDGSRIVSGSLDKTLRIWNARTGQPLLQLQGHTSGVTSVSWSPDGSRVASGSLDDTVRVWDAHTGQTLLLCSEHGEIVTSVAWSHDGSRIVSGSRDGTALIWDARTGKTLFELKGHSRAVSSVAWSADDSRVVTGSSDLTVRIWDAGSGELLHHLKGHMTLVVSVAWSDDNSHIASTGGDGDLVRIWDARTGEVLRKFKSRYHVKSLAWSGDGSRVVISQFKSVCVSDARTGQLLHEFQGHGAEVKSVAYSGDGSHIVSGSADHTVRVWDARTGLALLPLKGHTSVVTTVACSTDGSRIASGSYDKTVRIWDARTGHALHVLRGHTDILTSVALSDNGQCTVSGAQDKTVRVWDGRTGHALHVLKGHTDFVTSVSCNHNGSRIASGSWDKTVRIWDGVTGRQLHELKGHTDKVTSVAFSSDGRRILSGSYDKTVRIWDVHTGQLLRQLQGHTGMVWHVAWNKDDSRILSGAFDKTARIWDANTGNTLHEFKLPIALLGRVSWSGDGQRIVSGSDEKVARIWDAQTGQMLLELMGHTDAVWTVAWSKDGSHIITGSRDATVLVWAAVARTDTPASEAEQLRRLWLTRPDPAWHVQKRKEFLQDKNEYAAQWHHSWEYHARGVLAFESGDFHQALGHLLAAAALKPVPPP
jgi:WD40 repeat protein/serine/threonine protein kinase